jgi:drug/metabolite transporter (DMT)-like permease
VIVGEQTTPAAFGWGVAAGVFGGLGLFCFYRGLAIGPMSLVAPVAACGAAVPVVVAFALGRAPALVAVGGIAAALAGVVLVSWHADDPHTDGDARASLPYALGSALSFGLFFVFLHQGAEAGGPPLWVVAGARVGSLALLVLLALAVRQPLGWPGRRLAPLAVVGVVDTTANVLFTYAAASGNLGVVSVLGSLYPVATVLLARLVLAERLARPQAAGVGLALTGVALMAAG